MTSTSGSTGEPLYFPRSDSIHERAAELHDRFYVGSSLSKKASTLVIVCFGMGVWIGGLITYEAFSRMGRRRGRPIGIITPGINMKEILNIARKLAPRYEQLIFAGYPPFIKDVFDELAAEGRILREKKIAIVAAAEAFTEHFRDYLVKAGGIENALTDTMNIYGTAELGAMASETPLSILIRRIAYDHPAAYAALFGNIEKTPTLAQYDARHYFFEALEGELYVSADSVMPLVRYRLGDSGGILRYADITRTMSNFGIDIESATKKLCIDPSFKKMPFVYVYERTDLSTTLYGLQIYPSMVREALLRNTFQPFVTGRFTLVTKYDEAHDQFLEINLELKKGKEAPKTLGAQMSAEIVKELRERSAEFRELSNHLGDRAMPRLVFWPYEDQLYFKRDIKQMWVQKTA
ncbi:hypothetical protein COU20_03750 [Candidatus Kaiserbacteria bacterium CG10_big_fil_rev_8_21_14_0_10_59_10]|uniref:AMP-dependent synthetase/ligase domain-containing protein n=1 Tax=Candidatus Kaiserbacteria bacterium CG10_big_fil_rev_8_21_14_0_10_59_10 TaxID=1974612 RepID=A0A2H0U759_9BACT|nr:MAG: hypothetical protein COU20_03750 [Candidatus Kaiserbacteria bacterium CG10_big_fil_rev_8_21_14_0_10_59_10]